MNKWFNEAKALEAELAQIRFEYETVKTELKSVTAERDYCIELLKKADGLLRESQEHFTFGLEFGAKFPAPTGWMKRRDAFLNPKPQDY